MEKRTLLAVAVTALFLLTYPILLQKLGILRPQTEKAPQQNANTQPYSATSPELPNGSKSALPVLSSADKETLSIQQDWIRLVISSQTGSVQEIHLNRFKDFAHGDPLRFFWAQEGGVGWIQSAPGVTVQGPLEIRQVSNQSAEAKATLSNGLQWTQQCQLRPDQPAWEWTITWYNPTAQPIRLEPLVWMAGQIQDLIHSQDSRYVEVDALSQEGKLYRRWAHKLNQSQTRFQGPIEWIGWKGKYFSLLMASSTKAQEVIAARTAHGEIQTGIVLGTRDIAPREEFQEKLLFYAGPNNTELLAEVHQGMEKIVASGFLASIGQVLLAILNWFYQLVHSYGIAIILLTLFVNLILFPLTAKSMKSMRDLQKLQPKLKKMQETYKSNPQKLNKEMVELYRTHRVNPLGGCLPMVLQMPVFFALYQTLGRSIELRGAPFLWIQDLSGPDAIWKLPWGLPFLGNTINLLPILMILAMWWQQRLSTKTVLATAPADDPQRMMAHLMPIMFGFVFYNLPSGLVLYWLTNTLLMALYQFQITKT